MLLQIILLIVGLSLVVLGAEWLVNGASSIARRFGVSEFVIGLTIVGFGTSMPELVVSVTGSIEGLSDVSIGNVVGSNIFNTLLILGLTAVLVPVSITRDNKQRDIPIALVATLLLVLLGMRHTLFGIGSSDGITRWGGILFLVIFAGYVVFCFKNNKNSESDAEAKAMKLPLAVLLSLLGIGCLIGGGQLFVDSATSVARSLGVTEKFIAITILAGGTSLPELVTCVVAALKHKNQLALGNVLGSNVFNILLILGASATIHPITFGNINLFDMSVLLLSVLFLWLFAKTGKGSQISRVEGLLLLALFAAYYVYLFIKL
ncbi:MAG: calcium/sodium antiporter [Bacteroidales bacterium]|nr:calcium/sodium antiporter [Bacteroidales bacterium]